MISGSSNTGSFLSIMIFTSVVSDLFPASSSPLTNTSVSPSLLMITLLSITFSQVVPPSVLYSYFSLGTGVIVIVTSSFTTSPFGSTVITGFPGFWLSIVTSVSNVVLSFAFPATSITLFPGISIDNSPSPVTPFITNVYVISSPLFVAVNSILSGATTVPPTNTLMSDFDKLFVNPVLLSVALNVIWIVSSLFAVVTFESTYSITGFCVSIFFTSITYPFSDTFPAASITQI